MIKHILSDVTDNFSYCVYDEKAREAAVFDPVAVKPLKAFIEQNGLIVKWVFNTHHHGDHTSGNRAFLSGGAELWLSAREHAIGRADRTFNDGDVLEIAGSRIRALFTPGHTVGGVSYVVDDEALISGDTLFLSGSGNPNFGGDPNILFETFDTVYSRLPGHLRLCPGHEYSEHNLEFTLSVDPDNQATRAKLDAIRDLSACEFPVSTLAEERTYNPFLRYREPTLRRHLGMPQAPDRDVFLRLRRLKNEF